MVKVSHTVLSIGIILDYKGLTLHLWLTTISIFFFVTDAVKVDYHSYASVFMSTLVFP